jgi:2-polyprenyl-3-methyl-5-hydroxy-6-metoxy-1,4-benzoquinol methylase
MGDGFGYSGIENLEVMQEAVNYNRYLLSLVTAQLDAAHRVLDFGAGTGTFALPLHRSGVGVIAIEPDAMLRSRLTALGIDARPSMAGIPGESLDLVYTFNVLEHIEDDAAVARELARTLKPGGRLVVYVPAFAILWTAMDRKVGHFRRYRRSSLVALLAASGFRIVAADYVDSLGFFATLLYRLSGDGGADINRSLLRAYDRFVFPLSRLLDRLFARRFLGKNLLVVAERDR